MPGPNSAPNGDKSLVDGSSMICKACKNKVFPKREHLAQHKMLRTGKTGR